MSLRGAEFIWGLISGGLVLFCPNPASLQSFGYFKLWDMFSITEFSNSYQSKGKSTWILCCLAMSVIRCYGVVRCYPQNFQATLRWMVMNTVALLWFCTCIFSPASPFVTPCVTITDIRRSSEIRLSFTRAPLCCVRRCRCWSADERLGPGLPHLSGHPW